LSLELRQRAQDRQEGVPDEFVVRIEVRFHVRVESDPIAVEFLQVHDRLHHPLAREAVQGPEQHHIEPATVCVIEQLGELPAALCALAAGFVLHVLGGDLMSRCAYHSRSAMSWQGFPELNFAPPFFLFTCATRGRSPLVWLDVRGETSHARCREGAIAKQASRRDLRSRLGVSGIARRSAFYPDGRVGEVFVTNHKAGSAAGVMASDAAMVAAIALRYGVSPEVLRRALMRDPEGRASSPLGRKLDQLAAEEAV
jgi:hypothetical protein